MKSKNKSYGFPYNYSNRRPLHKFVNETNAKTFTFYTEGSQFALVEQKDKIQQRVLLDETAFNNMLGFLDRNGWKEIAV